MTLDYGPTEDDEGHNAHIRYGHYTENTKFVDNIDIQNMEELTLEKV